MAGLGEPRLCSLLNKGIIRCSLGRHGWLGVLVKSRLFGNLRGARSALAIQRGMEGNRNGTSRAETKLGLIVDFRLSGPIIGPRRAGEFGKRHTRTFCLFFIEPRSPFSERVALNNPLEERSKGDSSIRPNEILFTVAEK